MQAIKERSIEQPTKITVPHSASSDVIKPKGVINWNPILGILAVLIIFAAAEFISSLVLAIYPALRGWSAIRSSNWLQDATSAQFFFVLFCETISVTAIYYFVRHFKQGLGILALHRPRLKDPLYGLIALPVYLILYGLMVALVTHFVHGLNINQQQQIGFNHVHGAVALILTAISLIVLPPIAEELMFRGLLYTSLRKWLPAIGAGLITSIVFASAHLPEGAGGLFWIGALDTFILSLVLVFLREKTQNLWASMTLHASKNAIAFYALFLTPLIHIR